MSTKSTTSLKDFELISKLGEGAFAEVFKVKRKEDGLYYAMKKVQLHLSRSAWPELKIKIEIMPLIKSESLHLRVEKTLSSTNKPSMMNPALLFASSWSMPKAEIC